MTTKEVNTKEKRKKKIPTWVFVFLSMFILINLVTSFFVIGIDVQTAERNSEIIKNAELTREVKELRAELLNAKKQVNCNTSETKNEEPQKTPIGVEVKFYEEYKDNNIEIPNLCTNCKIREAGKIINTTPHKDELIGLKYLIIESKVDDYQAYPRIFTNADNSKFYTLFDDAYVYSDSNSNLFDKEYDIWLITNLLPENIQKDEIFKSTKGLHYTTYYYPFTMYSLGDIKPTDVEIEEVDTYKNTPIYKDKNKKDTFYIKTKEHFLASVQYVPSLTIREKDAPYPITWEGDIPNKENYHYGYDYCSSTGLWEVEEKKEDLKITGHKTGTEEPIYEHKDSQHSSLKKLYEEDYLKFHYEYRENTEAAALTYEEYLTKHPIIFWEDEVGRLIKFYNLDYIMVGGCAKPIIYLYPERETLVNVKVLPTTGELTFTLPKYENMWTVLADRNSTIRDTKGDTYEYLWWESTSKHLPDITDGFVVKNENLEAFLNLALTQAGFNHKEINDFKEFWIPEMKSKHSPYYKIHFLQNEDVNILANLLIYPKPTTEIRIFMIYERLNEYEEIKPQEIKHTSRKGFTVAEWGGTRR